MTTATLLNSHLHTGVVKFFSFYAYQRQYFDSLPYLAYHVSKNLILPLTRLVNIYDILLAHVITLAQKVNISKISQNHFFEFFNAQCSFPYCIKILEENLK